MTIQKKSHRRKFLFLGVFLFILSSAAILFSQIFDIFDPSSHIVVPLAQQESKNKTLGNPTKHPQFDIQSVQQIINDSLQNKEGDYSIYIKDLTSGMSFGYHEHESYVSASIYKLWILAETFRQIKQETLQHNQILSQDIAVLNRKFQIDPEYAEQTSGGITLTVDEALHKMITISHNYAAMLLTEKVRLSNVADLLREYKFNESKIGDSVNLPKTTAYDTAAFLEQIYNGTFIDKDSSLQMLNLLKQQELNEKLPKYLPKEAILAHKTGELDQYSHDAGIIFSPKGDYILVIFSRTENPLEANELMAQVSKNIYDAFTKIN